MLSFLQPRSPEGRGHRPRSSRCHLVLEPLEERLVPYALSGYTWASLNVSASIMPDGTVLSSLNPSNLNATYNAAYPTATWQLQFARALQTWADSSNLNFHFVSDDGSPQTTAGQAQGDPRFGDIRLGGYNVGAGGIVGTGWNPSSTTLGGDITLNTYLTLAIGSMPDLYSVLLHETGHAIGFLHSSVDPAVMEAGLWGTFPGIYADDIAGLQAMYGARQPDAYDAKASNDTLATATPLTLSYGGISTLADITTMADVDYYRLTVPSGSDGTLTVSADARNLSLFDPKVSIFNSSGTLVATASASRYGSVATVHLSGLVAGQTYYLEVSGATADVFGMGAYNLNTQFGGIAAPAGPGPDRFEPNDTFATATQFSTLTSLSQTNLTLHTSTDVDYYTFTAGSKGSYTVSITPTSGSGTLALTVYNAQQTALATAQSASGGDSLTVTLAAGQQVYIKVWSPTGSLFTYSLSMGKSGGGTGGGGTGAGGGKHLVLGDNFYQNAAEDPDSPSYVPPSSAASLSHTPSSGVPLPTGTNLGVMFPSAAGVQSGPAGVLLNLGQQTLSVLAPAATVPPAVPTAPNQSFSTSRVPGLPPIHPNVESGGGATSIGDEELDEAYGDRPARPADPAGTPVEPKASDPARGLSGQPARDASFGTGIWTADLRELRVDAFGIAADDTGPAPDPGTTAATLAVLLVSFVGEQRAHSEPRKRRNFQI